MSVNPKPLHRLALELAGVWSRLERQLSGAVSFRGVSFSEYRLLRALADAPDSTATRVDLAAAVALTPSGVTRALRPLEKIHVVTTVRSERDARLALATLTEAGEELVSDCTAAMDDAIGALLGRSADSRPTVADLVAVMSEG